MRTGTTTLHNSFISRGNKPWLPGFTSGFPNFYETVGSNWWECGSELGRTMHFFFTRLGSMEDETWEKLETVLGIWEWECICRNLQPIATLKDPFLFLQVHLKFIWSSYSRFLISFSSTAVLKTLPHSGVWIHFLCDLLQSFEVRYCGFSFLSHYFNNISSKKFFKCYKLERVHLPLAYVAVWQTASGQPGEFVCE